METKRNHHGLENLRFVSSGTKIINQFIMFIVVGLLPVLFPRLIAIENGKIVFVVVSLALVTSYIYEVWRSYLEKRSKDTTLVINLQLMTSVILLTLFLHFFGRINGPFFVLFLLTIMESALNLNIGFLNIVVGIAVFSTVTEFVWLIWTGEIVFNLYIFLQLLIRLVSLFFMRSYALSLAQKIISEQELRNRAQESAARLEEATKELKRANFRLKELSLLKDEFVSIASHELRTPMTTIKSYLWLVLNKGVKLDEKTKKSLQIAYISTERTIALVKDMLTVSRIEGQKLDINPVICDIREIAQQTYEDLKFKADEKKIKYSLEKFDSPLMVKADKDKIREVFQNIIGNALKFTSLGGKVNISFLKDGGMIDTSVSDTGPGISKNDLPKLFQKFSRLGNSFSKMAETPGTGLGLYIAKQIVSLHGGKILVKSKEGQGSTFTFSLPEVKEEK